VAGAGSRTTRAVLHVDLDYFFAQCEERENPSLKGRPVVVCVYSARGGDSGAVSTANYVARGHGVRAGIPIALAKRRLRGVDAAFLPVNRGLYEAVSQRIMAILRRHADRFEQVGIDEAYLDVTRRVDGDFERARELAQRIKAEVSAEEGLTCSVGVGPNKLVAKMAAGSRKPDGLTVVTLEKVPDFLSPLPAGELYGVGAKTEKRLGELGIKTVDDLSKYDAAGLIEVFGKSFGLYLHRASRGIDDTPVQERGMATQISRITTLGEDTRDPDAIMEAVRHLSRAVHAGAAEQNLRFRSVALIAVTDDLKLHTRSKALDGPTDDLEVIAEASEGLLNRFLSEVTGPKVRRVGVRLSGLEKGKGQRKLTEFGKTSH